MEFNFWLIVWNMFKVISFVTGTIVWTTIIGATVARTINGYYYKKGR